LTSNHVGRTSILLKETKDRKFYTWQSGM